MDTLFKRAIVCILLCVATISLRAQVVVTVITNDGAEQAITMAADGELQISDESLTVVATVDDTYAYALDEVSKVLFSGYVGIRNVESGPKIDIVPNPASDGFTVNGLADGRHELALYASNGVEMMRRLYSAGEYVDISALPQGLYLVRIDNSVAKLIKK